eukprot:8522074-Heterocapsa_arctica.AAC.1
MEAHGWIQYGPVNTPAQERGGARGIFWDPVREAQDEQAQEQETEGEDIYDELGNRLRPMA